MITNPATVPSPIDMASIGGEKSLVSITEHDGYILLTYDYGEQRITINATEPFLFSLKTTWVHYEWYDIFSWLSGSHRAFPREFSCVGSMEYNPKNNKWHVELGTSTDTYEESTHAGSAFYGGSVNVLQSATIKTTNETSPYDMSMYDPDKDNPIITGLLYHPYYYRVDILASELPIYIAVTNSYTLWNDPEDVRQAGPEEIGVPIFSRDIR
jgi:hypothetical protein